jgi:hypothetical protein
MRTPLDSYGPGPETDPPPGFPRGDRSRWLQWLLLATTSALLVLFVNQSMQLQEVNRRIARLFERMEQLDRSRMMDSNAALEAQQRTMLQRLATLETRLNDLETDTGASSGSTGGSSALQAPPPPTPVP